jgi:putative salt-induced outer membrane protein YdiY
MNHHDLTCTMVVSSVPEGQQLFDGTVEVRFQSSFGELESKSVNSIMQIEYVSTHFGEYSGLFGLFGEY